MTQIEVHPAEFERVIAMLKQARIPYTETVSRLTPWLVDASGYAHGPYADQEAADSALFAKDDRILWMTDEERRPTMFEFPYMVSYTGSAEKIAKRKARNEREIQMTRKIKIQDTTYEVRDTGGSVYVRLPGDSVYLRTLDTLGVAYEEVDPFDALEPGFYAPPHEFTVYVFLKDLNGAWTENDVASGEHAEFNARLFHNAGQLKRLDYVKED